MKIRIFLRSFNKEKINIVSKEISDLLIKENCTISGIIALPTKVKKFCVLRSPHVNKDSREHFEIRLYKQFIDIITDSTTIFKNLLNLNIPAEVSSLIKIL